MEPTEAQIAAYNDPAAYNEYVRAVRAEQAILMKRERWKMLPCGAIQRERLLETLGELDFSQIRPKYVAPFREAEVRPASVMEHRPLPD